jgi:hypothetical protein
VKPRINNKIIKHRRRPLPNDTEKVRIMVVNCQSLRKRKDIFQTSIAKMRPDVIIGTEYWLDPSIKDGDIFPEEPVLSGECMWLLLYKVLNEFVDSGISMESNKLVEKFGIPQFVQHHIPGRI